MNLIVEWMDTSDGHEWIDIAAWRTTFGFSKDRQFDAVASDSDYRIKGWFVISCVHSRHYFRTTLRDMKN